MTGVGRPPERKSRRAEQSANHDYSAASANLRRFEEIDANLSENPDRGLVSDLAPLMTSRSRISEATRCFQIRGECGRDLLPRPHLVVRKLRPRGN